MKKLVAIFAVVAVLLQTFSQVVIMAEFFARRDYIAANLCENRDKPKMNCCGKCCLKKKLANDSRQQAPGNNQRTEQSVLLFFAHTSVEIVRYKAFRSSPVFLSRDDMRIFSYVSKFFHPPGIA